MNNGSTKKRFRLMKNFGDYDLTDGNKHLCYDLCSEIMTKENWNNVVDRLNELYEENQELYDFRLVLNALLFNEWVKTGRYEVYKSKRHYDGELCYGGEWFVVVAILPTGQVSNHYHIKDWDYFKIPSYEKVKEEFDGHTSADVLSRYGSLLNDYVVKWR